MLSEESENYTELNTCILKSFPVVEGGSWRYSPSIVLRILTAHNRVTVRSELARSELSAAVLLVYELPTF